MVIINQTVLAFGPTETTFTPANLAKAFGGALRHLRMDHTDVPDGRPNEFMLISDDENPLIVGPSGKLEKHHSVDEEVEEGK